MPRPERSNKNKVFHISASLLCAVILFSLWSCGNNGPDVSNIRVDLQTKRLDRDLAKIDTNHIAEGLKEVDNKYPNFLNFYLDTLLGLGVHGDFNDLNPAIQHGVRTFLAYKDYRGVFDSVNVHFPDTKETDAKLTKGFQYMKYYYPNYHVPVIIYLTTGLANWGAFTFGDSTLAIGLDMFLGKNYPFYKSVGLPDYLAPYFTPDYIPVAAFSAVYNDMHPFDNDKPLLDMMVQKGKMQYFLSKVVPFIPDTTRLGYTAKQLKWCENNEGDIYNFFIKENLLYETSQGRVLRYVTDGPNSTGMPDQSPGNIGTWVGYRIVESYMKQNPSTTMEQLFNNKDAQKILEQAKYKPR